MIGLWIGLGVIACMSAEQQVHFLIPNCGRTSYPSAVVRVRNGQSSIMGTAPFMAYLYVNSTHRCGGSIITERYILTAGHCLLKGLKVRLGEHDIRTNPDCDGTTCLPSIEIYDVEKSILHEGYNNDTLANDIALLKLNRRIRFKVHIQPVCLIRSPTYLPQMHDFQAFGWGKTANSSWSNVLQTTKLQLYNSSYCYRIENKPLTQYQICAGWQMSDTCHGDSGGPFVTFVQQNREYRYLQLGLVSFGYPACSGLGVYTYLPNYINWIWTKIHA